MARDVTAGSAWRAGHTALLAGLVAGLVALPAVRNGYVEDAHWVIEQRPLLSHPPSAGALLLEPYWPRTFGGGVWRPAVLLTYALDRKVSDGPHWLHAVDVAWAAVAAGLLALLAAELAGPAVGLAAGLLFAVHPVHVEVTASGVGRAELMAAAAYAAALLCSWRAAADRRWLWGVVLGSVFAIASKEHAATLPATILLLALARGTDRRRALLAAGCAALPILLYFLYRPVVTGATFAAGGIAPGLRGLGAPERAAAMLPVSLQWWRLFLAPLQLSADYSPAQVPVRAAFSAAHALALAAIAVAAGLAWRLRARVPLLAVGLAWTAITLAPVSNVLIPTEILLAERTLYLPSWGVVLALAAAGAALPWPPRWRAALLAAVVLAGAGRSVARAGIWRDDDRWFAALRHDAPRSYRTLWMEGQDAFAQGRRGTGEQLLRAAITAAPDLTGPREDLAAFYAAGGMWAPAIELLRQSLALDSARSRPWTMLPQALLASGDTAGAAEAAAAAMRRLPEDREVALGALGPLLASGLCDEARRVADGLRGALRPDAAARLEVDLRACRGYHH
jgi:protein O-mannosyl-transferase